MDSRVFLAGMTISDADKMGGEIHSEVPKRKSFSICGFVSLVGKFPCPSTRAIGLLSGSFTTKALIAKKEVAK